MRARADVLTLLAAAFTVTCWSLNFPFIRYALHAYRVEQIALLRLIFASATMAVLAVPLGVRLPARRDVPAFLGFGLSGLAGSSLFLALGLRTVSAGAGSFLVGTIPIFSALLARAVLRERLGTLGWAGIVVSFCGVALIAVGEGHAGRLNPGVGWLMASAVCQSLFYVFQKPYHRRYGATEITCYAVWSGTLFLLPLLPGLPAAVVRAPLGATVAVGYIGVFPIAVGFILWSWALARAKAAKVTSAMYAMPAVALSVAWLWLGEVPAVLSVTGGLVALAGVAVLNLWGR